MFKIILSLSLIVLLTYGCNQSGQQQYTDTPTYGEIKIASDETLVPICNYEIQVFEGIYQYAKITPLYYPERDAFKALLDDSVRLILAARKLSKKEEDFFTAKKIYPRQREIALDGVALIIHPSNNDSMLSVSTLKDILTGHIQRWEQINKKSRLGKIQVVFDNPASSTVRFAMDSITKGEAFASNLSALDYNKDVIDYVSRNTNALGIIGVSWVSDKTDSTCLSFLKKVKVVALSKEKEANYDNSYKPFQAYIKNKSYPLTRSIYVINAEPRQGLASGFAAFVASYRGQLIILKSGILPTTQPVNVRTVEVKNDY